MAVASFDYERFGMNVYIPDLGYETFVAKIQKAKTRKGKDYFVSRITIPKEVINQIDAKPGDYLFFQAKRAEWFHMLDWKKMETTWSMLPNETKMQVIMDRLVKYGQYSLVDEMFKESLVGPGATNPGGGFPLLENTVTNASNVKR